MKNTVSIFIPLWTGKTKEIKTEIKNIKRQIQTIPKDDYVYDGDYENDNINGKGKLFYQGKLKYDGEWKNGEFSGKGVLFNDNSSYKSYEGIFKKGFFDGKGILYRKDSSSKEYEGNFKKGQFNGEGTTFHFYSPTKTAYKGMFRDGKRNGKGCLYWDSGKVKEDGYYKDNFFIKGKIFNDQGIIIRGGNFNKHSKLDGKGKKYEKGKVFEEGSFKDDKLEGKGICYYKGTNIKNTEGNFKDGQLNGEGTIFYSNGKINSIGTFKDGKENGKGKIYFSNGNIYLTGIFKNGKLDGKGSEFDKDTGIIVYEGNYKDGKENGKGKEYEYDTGDIIYDGMWRGGKKNGKGKTFFADGGYSIGIFKNGDREGKGKTYTNDGILLFSGMFKKDEKNGYGSSYYADGNGLKYNGNFKNGNYNGKGTLYDFFGYHEVGNFLNGERHGKIKEYNDDNGKIVSIHTWKNGVNDGIGYLYFPNGKVLFKGYFKDKKREGKGVEYNEDGSIKRKGVWENNEFISKDKKEENMREVIKKENNIKKFLQEDNKKHLETIKPKDIKDYLKKYARKEVKGNRKKLIQQLYQWKEQLHKPKETELKSNGPMVFDAYEGGEVPIKEFLEEENRVLLLDEKGHYYGAYLEQCEIIYECQENRSWGDYIGKDDVHSMIQFNTAEGPKFYFNTEIEKDLRKGFNLFHFKTEPKNLIVLSKNVADGGDIVSALHCDPKDIIKLSKIIKKEKIEKGLKKTINFTY